MTQKHLTHMLILHIHKNVPKNIEFSTELVVTKVGAGWREIPESVGKKSSRIYIVF